MNGIHGKKHYRIQLTTKTPLFIGAGIRYNRSQYVCLNSENLVFILDEGKLMTLLERGKMLDAFMEALERQGSGFDLYNFFKQNNRVFRIQSDKQFFAGLAQYTLDIRHIRDFRNHEIHTFVKDYYGNPYVPGSSLKGVLVSCILHRLLGKQGNKNLIGQIESEVNNRRGMMRLERDIERQFFNYDKQDQRGKSVEFKGMTGLQISDSEPVDKKNLVLHKKLDLVVQDRNTLKPAYAKIPLYRECLKEGTVLSFQLGIDASLFHPNLGVQDIQDLFAAVNLSFENLTGNLGVFAPYGDLHELLPALNPGKSHLQMGGGAGFHSKTVLRSLDPDPRETNDLTAKVLNSRFRQHRHTANRLISPRAIKVVHSNHQDVLMGICEIKVSGE